MKDTSIYKLSLLICFLMQIIAIKSQQINLDIDKWVSDSYHLDQVRVSNSGNWVAFVKNYSSNSDTTLVLSTERADKAKVILNLKPKLFLNEHSLLLMGPHKAAVFNLKNDMLKKYENVRVADVMLKRKIYYILTTDSIMQIYNEKSQLIKTLKNVADIVDNGSDKLYALIKNKNESEIVNIFDEQGKSSPCEHAVLKMEFTNTSKHLIITEKDKNGGGLRIALLDTDNNERIYPHELKFKNVSFIQVHEIGNGEAYFIDYVKREKRNLDKNLEILYGTDTSLMYKKDIAEVHEYIVFYPETNTIKNLFCGDKTLSIPIDSPRYFLHFTKADHYQHKNSVIQYDVELYDSVLNNSKKIFMQTSRFSVSPEGTYISFYNENEKKWLVYSTAHSVFLSVQIESMDSPVFSSDNSYVFFSEKKRLWKYHLEEGRLEALDLPEGKISFVNSKTTRLFQQYKTDFTMKTIDLQDENLVRIEKESPFEVRYFTYKNNDITELFPKTSNYISNIYFSKNYTQAISIEENFNIPPTIFKSTKNGRRQTVYASNKNDGLGKKIIQKVISYVNSKGRAIKGILYYPIDFDNKRKYPLVVSIYQVQSGQAWRYPLRSFSEIGFSKRLLIEKGYFVFQPDIFFDERGTGISALDCVHSGLDAISGESNIDIEKIGLMGHSLGGYETNFIATQSQRFKAYISGASVSDIIGTYFNFNEQYRIADYSRFETGQFEMWKPFTDDKSKYLLNNPIYQVENIERPMLIWGGKQDTNVKIDQSINLFMGLVRNKKSVIALLYKNQDHTFLNGSEDSKDMMKRVLDWWDYFLKEIKDIPWIDREFKKDAV